jgi:uncharacterized protein (TIGR02246 family)
MASDPRPIHDLIERWAHAVHAGDLGGVLADHAEDIVMFDVPPPHAGVRGIDAYTATWPSFFDWQRSGGSFEITELEVTAGQDAAFAWALLKCATQEQQAAQPELRLRLTIGLEQRDGRWVVTHEHHSFADQS